MDPLTHSLSGVILSRTGFYQRFGRIATLIFFAAAIAPDIDHFTLRLAGPLAYLKYHRGFTHSIAGGFILAILLALIAYAVKNIRERINLPTLFIISLLGIYTHIFLDLITSYGTQIFFPFNTKRYSLDLVFIIDFYFTAILIIPLIVMIFKKKWRRVLAFSSIIVISIYLGITYMEKSRSIELVKIQNKRLAINSINIDAIPLPFSPFRWSVFTEDILKFYQTDVDIIQGSFKTDSFVKYPENCDIIRKVEDLEIVKTYLWFARFPIVTIKEEDGGYKVEYYDLRFNSLPPRRPFLLSLFLDKKGYLISSELMSHQLK